MAADPIFCIQDAWHDGKLVVSEDDTEYHFRNGTSLPKALKTVLRDHEGTGDPIELRTLVQVVQSIGMPHGLFRQETRGSNISYPDRRDLEAFLTGQRDATKCLPAGADIALADFPSAKRRRTEDGSVAAPKEPSGLANVLRSERQLRDRNTQLLVPGKSFKRVLDFVQHAQKKLNDKERGAERGDFRRDSHSSHSSTAGSSRRRREENGHVVPPPPPPPPPPGAPPPPSSRPPRPSSQHHGSSSAAKHRLPYSSSKHGPGPHKGRDKKDVRGMMPIIIVPAAATANINMANAKEFLENGVYRQPKEAGGPRQAAEKFVRTMGRKSPGIPYLVTNKAPDTKSEDWRRVVAVFVTGQTWQFKGWPHEDIDKGNLAHALSKMLGVYVGLKGEPLPDTVKSWNVLKLEIPKNDRHKDRPIVAEIFTAIDKFLASHQCELAF